MLGPDSTSTLSRRNSLPYFANTISREEFRHRGIGPLELKIFMHALRIDLRILGLIREFKHSNSNMRHYTKVALFLGHSVAKKQFHFYSYPWTPVRAKAIMKPRLCDNLYEMQMCLYRCSILSGGPA